MTKDGVEIVTATGCGEGRMTRLKLSFPNHIIRFNEYEVDELGVVGMEIRRLY